MAYKERKDILVCGYAGRMEKTGGDKPQFVPVTIILDPETGSIAGAHTPIYNPLIDAEFDRIFIGRSIYAGMDFYVRQIRAAMHLPMIEILIEALYDLYGNLLRALNRYLSWVSLPKPEECAGSAPEKEYDYFYGTTYLGGRLNSAFSSEMSVFVKVSAAGLKIEDCWFSKFGAFPEDRLRELFCGHSLHEDPQRLIDRINTYYRISGSKAVINVFTDLIRNCRSYYKGSEKY